jgi:hypothetical protein
MVAKIKQAESLSFRPSIHPIPILHLPPLSPTNVDRYVISTARIHPSDQIFRPRRSEQPQSDLRPTRDHGFCRHSSFVASPVKDTPTRGIRPRIRILFGTVGVQVHGDKLSCYLVGSISIVHTGPVGRLRASVHSIGFGVVLPPASLVDVDAADVPQRHGGRGGHAEKKGDKPGGRE